MSTLVTQGGPKRGPWSPKGVPKSIRMALGTSLAHKARPKRKPDLERHSTDQPFCPPLAARGRSKGPFWIPGGSKNDPQIDMGRQGRHLGGQGGPKGSSNGGSKMGPSSAHGRPRGTKKAGSSSYARGPVYVLDAPCAPKGSREPFLSTLGPPWVTKASFRDPIG